MTDNPSISARHDAALEGIAAAGREIAAAVRSLVPAAPVGAIGSLVGVSGAATLTLKVPELIERVRGTWVGDTTREGIAFAAHEPVDGSILFRREVVTDFVPDPEPGDYHRVVGSLAAVEARLERTQRERDEARAERDAFEHDLTNLREGLMERAGGYTPSDADLLAYVDALKGQIDAPVPAEQPPTRPADPEPSGTLGDRLRAFDPHDDREWKDLDAFADEADRLQAQTERDRADLDAAATMRERLEAGVNSLEQQKDQWRDSANSAEAQVERVLALAQRWDDDGQNGIARLVREAAGVAWQGDGVRAIASDLVAVDDDEEA